MIKKIFLTIILLYGIANADDLTVQINKEIDFSVGFGQIDAKPILKDVKAKITMLGEFNVDEKNRNVVLKIDRVSLDDKIYTLSEAYESKRRLKNPKVAKLKAGSKMKVSQGNNAEILAILNGTAPGGANAMANGSGQGINGGGQAGMNGLQNNSGSTDSSSTTSATKSNPYSSGLSSMNPYGYGGSLGIGGNSDKVDLSTATTNSDGTCKANEIKDGMAYVYKLEGGECVRKAAAESLVFTKSNSSTCPNKIDYSQKVVHIGKESYVIIDDTEYRVSTCQYENPLQLQSEIGSCPALPNFEKKTAQVQRQYWYILNNEKVNVGGCTPAGSEEVAITDGYEGLNKCGYRYDFENFKVIKQTQWYYTLNNEIKTLGDCIDVENAEEKNMVYPMYQSRQDCSCSSIDGIEVCSTKLMFKGFKGGEEAATDCQIMSNQGVNIIDEFAGYDFNNNQNNQDKNNTQNNGLGNTQAFKVINQYFISDANGEKIYVNKNKKTNVAYPIKEESCGWQHDDTLKLSKLKTKLVFEDIETTDEEKKAKGYSLDSDGKVIVRDCNAMTSAVIYWQEQLGLVNGDLTKQHEKITLMPEAQSQTSQIYYIRNIQNDDGSNPKLEEQSRGYGVTTSWDKQLPLFDRNLKGSKKTPVVNNKFLTQRKEGKGLGSWNMPGTDNYSGNAFYFFYLNWDKTYNLTMQDKMKNITIKYISWALPYYDTSKTILNNESIEKEIDVFLTPTHITINTNEFNGTYPNGYTQDDLILIKETETDGRCSTENIFNNTKSYSETKEVEKEHEFTKEELQAKGYPSMNNEEKKEFNEKHKLPSGKIGIMITEKENIEKFKCVNKVFSLGYSFEPNYDDELDKIKQDNCPIELNQKMSISKIEEIAYELPDMDSKELEKIQTDPNTYKNYIEKHKQEAMKVDNYKIHIKEITCSADKPMTESYNWYRILADIGNQQWGYTFDGLEAEALNIQLSLSHYVYTTEHTEGKNFRKKKVTTWYGYIYFNYAFATKSNWATNQIVYEYPLYVRFKRPDGTIFDLYSRQGYFTQTLPKQIIYKASDTSN